MERFHHRDISVEMETFPALATPQPSMFSPTPEPLFQVSPQPRYPSQNRSPAFLWPVYGETYDTDVRLSQ